LLDLNPFYWLAGRDRMKGILVWVFLGAGALLWSWGLWRYPVHWRDGGAYVWTALIAHTALKFWIGTEACRRFGADRKSGALELLLSTPLTVSEIIGGQLLALFKQFAAPAAIVLLADFVFLMAERNESDWTVIWVAGMSVFVADLITLSWVGMWTGLSSHQTNRAAGAAVVRVLVLPWMLFGLVMTMVALTPSSGQRLPSGVSEGQLVVICWIAICLLNDLLFGLWARHRLFQDFRSVATQQYRQRQPAMNAPSEPH
jgi:ABC-type transport system involved in cytochrome c biogenesis permease component